MGYFDRIWRVVLSIPRGKVATYGEIARAAGYPGGAHQVAWALRHRAAQELPWQRVLGAGGRIRLPGESGLLQRTLLELEGVRFIGGRADMQRCGYRPRGLRRSRRSNRSQAA